MEDYHIIQPMKAKLSDPTFLAQVSDDKSWAAGEKLDGYREILYIGAKRNEMLSSLGTSHIAQTPQFGRGVYDLRGTVLDCEGLSPTRYLEDTATCFKSGGAVQWQKEHGQAFLLAFDILYYLGRPVFSLPFRERVVLLSEVIGRLKKVEGFGDVRQEKLVYEGKMEYWESIVARKQTEGHEGVILKLLSAPYSPGKRGNAWLKVKREETVIATITGFLPGCGKFEGMIGSVVFKNGVVEGSASGMDDDERRHMTEHMNEYLGQQAIFVGQSITRYGALRHPRYKGLVK